MSEAGNVSPKWLACASRVDGSRSGISEVVPSYFWPVLEALSAALERERVLKAALEKLQEVLTLEKRSLQLIYETTEARDRAKEFLRAKKLAPSPDGGKGT